MPSPVDYDLVPYCNPAIGPRPQELPGAKPEISPAALAGMLFPAH